MKTKLEYTIISDEFAIGLITKVDALIQEDWIPMGGVAIESWDTGQCFIKP